MSSSSGEGPARLLRLTGYSSFLLIGWVGLILPSAIRDMKVSFGQDNAGIGLAYFSYFLAYMIGTLTGGIATERLGRRLTLPVGTLLMATGLAGCATVPAWPQFILAYAGLGAGAGSVDSGVNGLFMDLFAHRPSGALSRVHLFFSLGAMIAPLVIGQALGAGVSWPIIFAASAMPALILTGAFRGQSMPAGRKPTSEIADKSAASSFGSDFPAPLVALAVAVACYVPSEIGVSSWMVEYLSSASIELATLALGLFLAGHAGGRFISSLISDRFDPVQFAVANAATAGLLTVAAVLAPVLPLKLVLFTMAGLASGPIIPIVMAIGGLYYPGRTSLVSGLLTAASISGAVVYPPLMGWIAVHASLAIGMAGAGMFGVACAAWIALAGRLDPRRRAP